VFGQASSPDRNLWALSLTVISSQLRLANEPTIKIFLEKISKGFHLNFGGAIDWSKRRVLTFLKLNVVIKLGVVVRKLVRLHFAEEAEELVIVSRDLRVKSVEFISGEFVGFGRVERSVRVGGFDMKDTGLDVVNPCEHVEGSGIHEAD
jgi:hypothetical protein